MTRLAFAALFAFSILLTGCKEETKVSTEKIANPLDTTIQEPTVEQLKAESPDRYEGIYVLQATDNNPVLNMKLKHLDRDRYFLEIADGGIKSCSFIGEITMENDTLKVPLSNYVANSKAVMQITFEENLARVTSENAQDSLALKSFCKNTATIAGEYVKMPRN